MNLNRRICEIRFSKDNEITVLKNKLAEKKPLVEDVNMVMMRNMLCQIE